METTTNGKEVQPETPIKVPHSIERIMKLEQELPRFLQAFQFVDNEISAINMRVSTVEEILDAVFAVQGPEFLEKVQKAVEDNREDQRQKKLTVLKQAVAKMVEEKRLEVATEVGPGTMMMVCEYNKEGKVKGVGYNSSNFNDLSDEHKALFLGKTVGHKADIKDGELCEVVEIYRVLETAKETLETEPPASAPAPEAN